MDDCVSIDTKNEMIWVHNLDFFYGKPGSASDQKKGDGTLDIKGHSHWCTFSYNHFWDSGKSSLGGMKSESTTDYNTYHHNWFDHSDSRHPRIRTMSMHIYNNYFDGNSKYGVGMTYGGSAFVEQNYFRHCKYPMLISKQGTDATGSGTFSGENGGVIKSYGNVVIDAKSLVTYQQNSSSWDCWEAASAGDQVPADVVAKAGGTSYNNFDTDASVMYDYTPDAASDVPDIVAGTYGAGRMQHGDFQWTFNNATEDTNDNVIPELKAALENYQSTWVSFFSGTTAIREITTDSSDCSPLYDLQGRRVSQPKSTNIYIQNGHKSIYK
jgi:pectate lyase